MRFLSKPNIFSILLLTTQASALYELDDRHDLGDYPQNSVARNVAQGTAMVTIQKNLEVKGPGEFKMLARTRSAYQLKIEEPLCGGVRFQEQPVTYERAGSGFLVAPDLLVTAGHVIENQKDCDEAAILFGWGYFEPWTDLETITEQNHYLCKEILFTQNNSEADIALIRLDREVSSRQPLKYRKSGTLPNDRTVWMAGHPGTLPLKITENGKITHNQEMNHFVTQLDTFAGNSGGPVFDSETGQIEGVLIEGELTEMTIHGEWPGGCWYEKVFCAPENMEKIRCDSNLEDYTGAKSTRISVLWKYLP